MTTSKKYKVAGDIPKDRVYFDGQVMSVVSLDGKKEMYCSMKNKLCHVYELFSLAGDKRCRWEKVEFKDIKVGDVVTFSSINTAGKNTIYLCVGISKDNSLIFQYFTRESHIGDSYYNESYWKYCWKAVPVEKKE